MSTVSFRDSSPLKTTRVTIWDNQLAVSIDPDFPLFL